jgi:hypothetical protein
MYIDLDERISHRLICSSLVVILIPIYTGQVPCTCIYAKGDDPLFQSIVVFIYIAIDIEIDVYIYISMHVILSHARM